MLTLDLDDAEQSDRIDITPTGDGTVKLETRFRGKEAQTILTTAETEKLCELLWLSVLTARSMEVERG